MPTKLFLAAVEHGNRHEIFNSLGIRYRLISFFYLRKKKKERLDELLRNTSPENVVYLIDSGAFTLMNSKEKEIAENPALFWKEMTAYLDDYVKFLSDYKDRIFAAVELDLDSLLEREDVIAAAGKWKKPLEAWQQEGGTTVEDYAPPPVLAWLEYLKTSGVPMMSVWHTQRGKAAWRPQCTANRIVGLPSSEAGAEQKWFPFIREAKEQGAMIHALGMTAPQWIVKYPLYSVDSSTWLSGEKFGETMFFQNGRIRHYAKTQKDIRKRHRRMLESWGIDWPKLEKDDPEQVNRVNLVAWTEFALHIWNRPNKDYWTEELDGMPIGHHGSPCDKPGETLKNDPGADEPANPKNPVSVSVPEEYSEEPEVNPFRILNPTQSLEDLATESMKCNNCFAQDRCKAFQADADCHFKMTNQFKSDEDFTSALASLTRAQHQRVMMALAMERMDGGVLDRTLSGEVDRLTTMLGALRSETSGVVAPPAEGESEVASLLKGLFSTSPAAKPKRKKSAPEPVEADE